MKKLLKRTALAAWALSMSATGLHAQDAVTTVRPVQSIYSVEAGSSHITDTYLTPIKYSGWHIGLNYDRSQAMKFAPDQWVMQMHFGVGFDRDLNMARNRDMLYGELEFSWGMLRRWQLPSQFSAGVGGSASLNAGCIYLDRGGNNPASAKASLTVNLTAYAAWKTKTFGIPVTLRYQPTLPLIGAFFAPDYGELYYEIYLGNHSGLAHCSHWGNYFALNHQLTADFSFGSTTLRVGYKGDIYSTNVNHTVTNIFTHSAVIGVGGEWLSYKPGTTLSKDTKIITSTY